MTELTPFGVDDLVRVVETVRKFDIPGGVVLNRAGAGNVKEIEEYCYSEQVPVLLTVPLDIKIV